MVHWICNLLLDLYVRSTVRPLFTFQNQNGPGIVLTIESFAGDWFTHLQDHLSHWPSVHKYGKESDNNLTVLVCCSCPYTHNTSCAANITNLYTAWTDEEVIFHCSQANNKLTSTEGCYHGSRAFACSGRLKVVQAWYSQVSTELSHQQLVRIPQL